jgi:hypothetical protein
LTCVYGPQAEADKIAFLAELRDIRGIHRAPWALCGDFNMIYRDEDKNNGNLNRRMMGRFRRFLNDCELKEIKTKMIFRRQNMAHEHGSRYHLHEKRKRINVKARKIVAS